jgi:GNAT superfamily N-acetyltransferase
MAAAFGERFSEEDWGHALGGWHFFVRGSEGNIISHASVVPRKLEVSDQPLSAGYVEAVATQPEFQGKGLATAIMRVVGGFIDDRFQIGALSGDPEFYGRLGWKPWKGKTWYRRGEEVIRTAEEDGGILVVLTRTSPPLDLEEDIRADWRDGDVW